MRNSIILLMSFVAFFLICGCAKTQFKRKIEGTYSGIYVYHYEKDGVVSDTSHPGTAVLAWEEDKYGDRPAFTITSYLGHMWFRYQRGEYEYSRKGGNHPAGEQYDIKMIIKPKDDSLIIYGKRTLSRSGLNWSYDGYFKGKRE